MNFFPRSDRVCAVVVTYNGAGWVDVCLASLLQSEHPVQIIVIDNASTDNTVSKINTDYPGVLVLRNPKNLGFGQANNIGICYAIKSKADFVFLLNQDASVQRDTIGKLVSAFNVHSAFGIISPVHLNGQGTDFDRAFRSYFLRSRTENELNELRSRNGEKVQAVSFINAAAWMLRYECIRRAGGFAPLFFHYGEDRDYVNRIHYLGMELGVLPAATICHHRDERGIEPVRWPYQKKLRYYVTGCVVRAADVNGKLHVGFIQALTWCLKEMVLFAVKLEWRAPLIFFRVLFTVLNKMAQIRSHRKETTSKKPLLFLPCASE